MWSEHRFISFDETPIFYRVFTPAESPKALLIVIHGMGEHGGRYKALAEYLGGLGIKCLIPDLRGYGYSGGRRGFVKRFSDFQEDLKALHDYTERRHKGLPIFFLGHSFGGLLASSYLAFYRSQGLPAKGLVLSSPIFGIAVAVPAWRHALGLLSAFVLPTLGHPSGVLPEMLSHDPVMLEEYKRDKLIYHNVSSRLYSELNSMMKRKKEIAKRISLPVLMLQAGEDRVVSKEEALSFYGLLDSEDKELELYPGLYHEVLNETDRGKVFSRVGIWLLKHLNHN